MDSLEFARPVDLYNRIIDLERREPVKIRLGEISPQKIDNISQLKQIGLASTYLGAEIGISCTNPKEGIYVLSVGEHSAPYFQKGDPETGHTHAIGFYSLAEFVCFPGTNDLTIERAGRFVLTEKSCCFFPKEESDKRNYLKQRSKELQRLTFGECLRFVGLFDFVSYREVLKQAGVDIKFMDLSGEQILREDKVLAYQILQEFNFLSLAEELGYKPPSEIAEPTAEDREVIKNIKELFANPSRKLLVSLANELTRGLDNKENLLWRRLRKIYPAYGEEQIVGFVNSFLDGFLGVDGFDDSLRKFVQRGDSISVDNVISFSLFVKGYYYRRRMLEKKDLEFKDDRVLNLLQETQDLLLMSDRLETSEEGSQIREILAKGTRTLYAVRAFLAFQTGQDLRKLI